MFKCSANKSLLSPITERDVWSPSSQNSPSVLHCVYITPVNILKPHLWRILILFHGLPSEHSRTSELEVPIKLKSWVLAQEGTHSPASLWMPFLGSSHRVSFRVVSCHAGSPVRSKWKLKQYKQARMRYTAGDQSLAQLYEAVSLH